ncbi:oligosaccharide biosynthesis protein Alg14-like protein [Mycena rosella]|uniref:UDP-N-acetylglucosamine transferase subunit ALG14 n=1 Tax=Mycena rosella TaxID=1033263 RepID=A0AAD7GND5_MYCRO|nr:oligosaccharide biosynthesis protein Alg14-like protein [Mycena rosella]
MLYALAAILVLYRLFCLLPSTKRAVKEEKTKSLAVFLGSGGHTTEALTLISALDFDRYSPRTYVVSQGDSLSAQKARDLELGKATTASPPQYTILTIPRARRVHQSLATTPPTAFYSLLSCIYHVTFPHGRARASFADVLILNGPGTCFILCIAVYVNKFLGLSGTRVIYVESFARVESLSLSGKLLYPFVDRFVVQWPQLLKKAKGAEFHGLLV